MKFIYKVLIVDDHESIRDSLALLLARMQGFTAVGGIPNADLAVQYCRELSPDLVLMDVCTEGNASGLEAARAILQKYPHIKVIVMTAFDEISYAPRAKEAGASAFIHKSSKLAYFSEVIQGVMQGETFFPPVKSELCFIGGALTSREIEVLRLICRNMTSDEIARELYISENTVKYHKANILTKTGFTKIVDLAFFVISNGWINPLY